jgi:hypothetical protein
MLDIARTLLELGRYDIPTSMQGESLMAEKTLTETAGTELSEEQEEVVHRRPRGLGYIS